MTIARHPEVIGKNKKYKHKEFEPFVIKAGEIIDDKYFGMHNYTNVKCTLSANPLSFSFSLQLTLLIRT